MKTCKLPYDMVLEKTNVQRAVGAEPGTVLWGGARTDQWVTIQQEQEEPEKNPESVNAQPGHPKQLALTPTFSAPPP